MVRMIRTIRTEALLIKTSQPPQRRKLSLFSRAMICHLEPSFDSCHVLAHAEEWDPGTGVLLKSILLGIHSWALEAPCPSCPHRQYQIGQYIDHSEPCEESRYCSTIVVFKRSATWKTLRVSIPHDWNTPHVFYVLFRAIT